MHHLSIIVSGLAGLGVVQGLLAPDVDGCVGQAFGYADGSDELESVCNSSSVVNAIFSLCGNELDVASAFDSLAALCSKTEQEIIGTTPAVALASNVIHQAVHATTTTASLETLVSVVVVEQTVLVVDSDKSTYLTTMAPGPVTSAMAQAVPSTSAATEMGTTTTMRNSSSLHTTADTTSHSSSHAIFSPFVLVGSSVEVASFTAAPSSVAAALSSTGAIASANFDSEVSSFVSSLSTAEASFQSQVTGTLRTASSSALATGLPLPSAAAYAGWFLGAGVGLFAAL